MRKMRIHPENDTQMTLTAMPLTVHSDRDFRAHCFRKPHSSVHLNQLQLFSRLLTGSLIE
jgi:hypothetical protein